MKEKAKSQWFKENRHLFLSHKKWRLGKQPGASVAVSWHQDPTAWLPIPPSLEQDSPRWVRVFQPLAIARSLQPEQRKVDREAGFLPLSSHLLTSHWRPLTS